MNNLQNNEEIRWNKDSHNWSTISDDRHARLSQVWIWLIQSAETELYLHWHCTIYTHTQGNPGTSCGANRIEDWMNLGVGLAGDASRLNEPHRLKSPVDTFVFEMPSNCLANCHPPYKPHTVGCESCSRTDADRIGRLIYSHTLNSGTNYLQI